MIQLLDNTTLDEQALYFVSFESLVNTASYQQSGILTHGKYQYAAWYRHDRRAVIARRDVTARGDATRWRSFALPHWLSTDDSHNSISMGVSRTDGCLHVAMDAHVSQVVYLRSVVGLADLEADWEASSFTQWRSLMGVDIGAITYPQFFSTPEGNLQLSYRTGTSGDGNTNLAEYANSTWTNLGRWSSSKGTYTTEHGCSDSRSIYLHGIGYGGEGRLHASFTWREHAVGGAILCHLGGLSNHDTGYVYSDDRGRIWRTQDGAVAAVTGTDSLLAVDTPHHVVAPLGVDHGLMNQEAQAIDSSGRPHMLISYVPRRFTDCVTDFVADRRRWGRVFHLYKTDAGEWQETEIAEPLDAFGRSRLVLDQRDNAFVVMPGGRLINASAGSDWTDWTRLLGGGDLFAFGEVLVDSARVSGDGVLSVMYQERCDVGLSSPLHVLDIQVQFSQGC